MPARNYLRDLTDAHVAAGLPRRQAAAAARIDAARTRLPVTDDPMRLVVRIDADDRLHLTDHQPGGRPAGTDGPDRWKEQPIPKSVLTMGEWADTTVCGTTWQRLSGHDPARFYPRCRICADGHIDDPVWTEPQWQPDDLYAGVGIGTPMVGTVDGGACETLVSIAASPDRDPDRVEVIAAATAADSTPTLCAIDGLRRASDRTDIRAAARHILTTLYTPLHPWAEDLDPWLWAALLAHAEHDQAGINEAAGALISCVDETDYALGILDVADTVAPYATARAVTGWTDDAIPRVLERTADRDLPSRHIHAFADAAHGNDEFAATRAIDGLRRTVGAAGTAQLIADLIKGYEMLDFDGYGDLGAVRIHAMVTGNFPDLADQVIAALRPDVRDFLAEAMARDTFDVIEGPDRPPAPIGYGPLDHTARPDLTVQADDEWTAFDEQFAAGWSGSNHTLVLAHVLAVTAIEAGGGYTTTVEALADRLDPIRPTERSRRDHIAALITDLNRAIDTPDSSYSALTVKQDGDIITVPWAVWDAEELTDAIHELLPPITGTGGHDTADLGDHTGAGEGYLHWTGVYDHGAVVLSDADPLTTALLLPVIDRDLDQGRLQRTVHDGRVVLHHPDWDGYLSPTRILTDEPGPVGDAIAIALQVSRAHGYFDPTADPGLALPEALTAPPTTSGLAGALDHLHTLPDEDVLRATAATLNFLDRHAGRTDPDTIDLLDHLPDDHPFTRLWVARMIDPLGTQDTAGDTTPWRDILNADRPDARPLDPRQAVTLLVLCDCGHTRRNHPDDGPCTAIAIEERTQRDVPCPCRHWTPLA